MGEGGAAVTLLTTLGNVFTQIVTWVGNVISALKTGGAWADLTELFLIGIAISIAMVAVKIIRKVVWGN